MTWLYLDPRFQDHDTGSHPENAARIAPLLAKYALTAGGRERPRWEPASLPRLCQVHTAEHVDTVQRFADQGGGWIESDTVVSRQSFQVALLAAGAVCDAVQRVVQGEDPRAFCVVRPPGHHALADAPMGFCLFNNIATGAKVAIDELGLDRVLIVDWDVHHGNGTQATFWEDPQVGFFSIHRYPFYPGTGAREETGQGRGRGTTVNVPVRFGTPRADYLAIFASELERFAQIIKPQLVMISAGFDSHCQDPIGSLGLESEDFAELTRTVVEVARLYAEGKVVSVLEGGYHPLALAESVDQHLQVLQA